MAIRFLLTFILFSIQSSAFAAGAVPMGTVLSQIINISILVGAIYYFQRKSIAKFFSDKRDEYLKNVDAASESKLAAERKLAEIVNRVKNIEQSFKEQLKEAHKNADQAHKDQVAEAHIEAARMKQYADLNLEMEIQKQIETLRVETFQKSAGMAQVNLGKNLTPEQLTKWNNHFVAGKEGVH